MPTVPPLHAHGDACVPGATNIHKDTAVLKTWRSAAQASDGQSVTEAQTGPQGARSATGTRVGHIRGRPARTPLPCMARPGRSAPLYGPYAPKLRLVATTVSQARSSVQRVLGSSQTAAHEGGERPVWQPASLERSHCHRLAVTAGYWASCRRLPTPSALPAFEEGRHLRAGTALSNRDLTCKVFVQGIQRCIRARRTKNT
jgi:hypothetical protein